MRSLGSLAPWREIPGPCSGRRQPQPRAEAAQRRLLEIVCAGALAGWVAAFVAALNLKGEIPDAFVLIAAPALLVSVAALAAWLPARRAAALDPATVLTDARQC